MNTRRALLIVLGLTANAPISLFAQQKKAKIWRVGVLVQQAINTPVDQTPFGEFLGGMKALGYQEGKNVAYEWRSAADDANRLPAVAAEHRHLIAELAIKGGLPSIAGSSRYADEGVLLSYGAAPGANYRRGAAYVDKIFKGAKPADLPVEQPMTIEVVVNQKTARALGLTIPPEIMVQATRVIQ